MARLSAGSRSRPGAVAAALALAAAHCLLAAGAAQEVVRAAVVPIQVTGDAAARFSMVVLGDGYTAGEVAKFRQHLDKHLNVLWSIEPFRSYRSYINVYAVEIVSPESGITCDPEIRERRHTALRMQFGGGCSNPNARGISVDSAAAKAYAARATPAFDQILVIANTDTYGGLGGSVATTSGGNALGPLITPHELGHSLGRLQDEYTYSARGKPGGAYSGPEPGSPHLTLMTEDEMRRQQRKWWRWLDEPSESGGSIGRFEGGASRTTGVWRPSKHSMMISVGYYFDQVGRERMTQRISEQVALIAGSTPTDDAVGERDVIWIETAQPVYHDLEVAWQADGRPIAAAAGSRHLDLAATGITSPSTVSVTVTDPTGFVRDPEIRASALTATRTWRVGDRRAATAPADPSFTGGTQTERPVGGRDVIAVVTSHSPDRIWPVTWRLNGTIVPGRADGRTFALAGHTLPPGTHRLSAHVGDPARPSQTGAPQTRQWVVDNTPPTVAYTLSPPVASVTAADGSRHHFLRDQFTMRLDATDDQPGHVVAEFRVNGDGWHHYYGWPDAPPGTPFRFTARGTTIKELVYGSLSAEGLSPQPWEPREPGWGTHRIEYRGVDAAGNVGPAQAFYATLQPSPRCTQTITGAHKGDLRIDGGVTCVHAAAIAGSVSVGPGAAISALDARIGGRVTASGAASVELIGSSMSGLQVEGTTGSVVVFGSTVAGETSMTGNGTPRPALLAGSTFKGPVACSGNSHAPQQNGSANVFERGANGECRR